MASLNITVYVDRVQEVVSSRGTARMILFSGSCDGDCFKGVIDPGGVDTQFLQPDGSGTLSARYSLTGTAFDGSPARLFIENNACMGEATHPRIWTDNPCLSFLETAPLTGHIASMDGHLLITIETVE